MPSTLPLPLYAHKNWQNCAVKGCTVLPEQALSGSQNSSQNWPVLAARTGARTAQFWQPEQQPELLFWPELCCQNWQHSSGRTRQFWQKNHSQNTLTGCANVSAQSPEQNSGRAGKSVYMLPGLYREHPKLYSQNRSYRSTPFCGHKE